MLLRNNVHVTTPWLVACKIKMRIRPCTHGTLELVKQLCTFVCRTVQANGMQWFFVRVGGARVKCVVGLQVSRAADTHFPASVTHRKKDTNKPVKRFLTKSKGCRDVSNLLLAINVHKQGVTQNGNTI